MRELDFALCLEAAGHTWHLLIWYSMCQISLEGQYEHCMPQMEDDKADCWPQLRQSALSTLRTIQKYGSTLTSPSTWQNRHRNLCNACDRKTTNAVIVTLLCI